MTRDEAKAYLQKLATDAGLDDTQRNALAAALGNEKFADSVTDGFMLKSDYSRSKNEVAEEKKKAAEEYAKKYQELKAWSEQYNGTIEQARTVYDKYQKYVQAYGDIDDGGNGNGNGNKNGNQGNMLTLEQFTKMMDERVGQMARQTGTVIKSALSVSEDYRERFGKKLPMDELESFWAERQKVNPNLDMDTAYQQWIGPQVEELREKRHAEELRKAKEEGANEVRSKLHVPIDNGNRDMGPAWDANKRADLSKLTPEQQEQHAEDAFFQAWNEAGQATR